MGVRTGVSFGGGGYGRGQSNGWEFAGGYVYVIERDGDHRVKIGSSVDPVSRLASLQTGSADLLTIAYSRPVYGSAEAVEHEAHAILDNHRGLGEWFAVPPDVAVAAINAAAFRLGADVPGGRTVSPPKLSMIFLLGFFGATLPILGSVFKVDQLILYGYAIVSVVLFSFVVTGPSRTPMRAMAVAMIGVATAVGSAFAIGVMR